MLEVEPDNFFYNKNGEKCKRVQKPLGVYQKLNLYNEISDSDADENAEKRKKRNIGKVAAIFSNKYRMRNKAKRNEVYNRNNEESKLLKNDESGRKKQKTNETEKEVSEEKQEEIKSEKVLSQSLSTNEAQKPSSYEANLGIQKKRYKITI